MNKFIPYGRHEITDANVAAVVRALRSDWLSQGPLVPEFEAQVASASGASFAVAVNSGTSALHLACLALDVGPGDVVWTCPNTFIASANCARYCGADVDFVDIDPRDWCMSIPALSRKLVECRSSGSPLPKVVIPVHFGGQSCDMAAISRLAAEFGFRTIEDASHATGARYLGEPVGCCRFSDITVFSFQPVKIITTGEGGMALTNDATLASRMARLRTHGMTRDPNEMVSPSDGPWYYQQLDLGYNYRMTDFEAALGSSQFTRVSAVVDRRNQLAARYHHAFDKAGIVRQHTPDTTQSSWHLYVIRVPAEVHSAVFVGLRARDIGANLHYIPVHLQPYYRRLGFNEGQYPESEQYYREAITLPLFPSLEEADQDRVIEACCALVGSVRADADMTGART